MKDFILLFVGASGSGKSTIADLCCDRFGLTQVESYTTRERRCEEERGHTFVGVEAFLKLKHVIASTFYNGNYYGATQEQIDNADIYIVDPKGLDSFFDNYEGDKRVGVVYFDIPELERFKRMLIRGDTPAKAEERVTNDRVAFATVEESVMNYLNVLIIRDEDEETTLNLIEHFLLEVASEQNNPDWRAW